MKKRKRNWYCFAHKMIGLGAILLGLMSIKFLDGDATAAILLGFFGTITFLYGEGEIFERIEMDD